MNTIKTSTLLRWISFMKEGETLKFVGTISEDDKEILSRNGYEIEVKIKKLISEFSDRNEKFISTTNISRKTT